MKRPLEFALGFIGGLIGIAAGLFADVIGSMSRLETEVHLSITILVFPVIGIIGAFMVVNGPHTKVAGCLMIIAAIGISVLCASIDEPFFSYMSAIPLIIAGLMAVFKKTKA